MLRPIDPSESFDHSPVDGRILFSKQLLGTHLSAQTGMALMGSAISIIQHRRLLADLRDECLGIPRSTASLMSLLIMLLGVVAFFGALERH